MRIDLHTHSSASDGTDSPAGVIRAARAADLQVVALTDHDSTGGWAEAARAACELGVAFVPGIEISCRIDGISMHLLGYLFDPEDPSLVAELALTRGDRVTRARRMVDRIARDYPVTWQDVERQVPEGATVGRPHLADALIARGHVADRDEAFASILHSTSPYHVAHHAPEATRAVRLVRAAGGVTVMAHPRASRRGRVVSDGAIARLAACGLAALEVDHRDHGPREREELRSLARDLDLLTTGASDYHGTGKPNALGENRTDPEVWERLRALTGS